MDNLKSIFEQNKRWVAQKEGENPGFFEGLSKQQLPQYLWIGCADSRVPANEIMGMQPGEIFVHRNVANVVVHTDLNCLSVLQYAVEVLKVRHVIVCGHYGCGGVRAAYSNDAFGLIDNWLRHIKDVFYNHKHKIMAKESEAQRVDLLCELNVFEQVKNVCHTTIIQDAWKREQPVSVHGLIYNLSDGYLKDLGLTISKNEQIHAIYHMEA